MVRLAIYVLVGWALIAAVGALGHVLGLTAMLPPVGALIVAHAAFSRGTSPPRGLAVAIAIGYLVDQHDGAPLGVGTLAHALAYLGVRWLTGRYAVDRGPVRVLGATLAAILVDLATLAIVLLLSERLGVDGGSIAASSPAIGWHALAAALAATPINAVLDRTIELLRARDVPEPTQLGRRR